MGAARALKPRDPDEQRRLADDVMGNLSDWKPGPWPERPAVLTWDDGQIVDGYRSWERGDKLKKEERSQLDYFGSWRGALLKVEEAAAGKLQVLLRVATVLEYLERWEDLEQLRELVRDWYNLPLPGSGINQNPNWQAKICERYSQNRTLLPVWLRGMHRPPAGHETDNGRPPEEPEPQRSLSFLPEDP